jgi:hypothetical protein
MHRIRGGSEYVLDPFQTMKVLDRAAVAQEARHTIYGSL